MEVNQVRPISRHYDGVVRGIILVGVIAGCNVHVMFADPCRAPVPASRSRTLYGTDYLPRIDCHDGRAGPEACIKPLAEFSGGRGAVSVFAYNLQGPLAGARFRLTATTEIHGFSPAAGLTLLEPRAPLLREEAWVLDVRLTAADLCGPLSLGRLALCISDTASGFYVDVLGFEGCGPPVILDPAGEEIPAIAPRHGLHAGVEDVFHCQPPLCPEPHLPVTRFRPLQSGGETIELEWRAGGGSATMIRSRHDGRPPRSVFDGELLALLPTEPGAVYAVRHPGPRYIQYWYTAFSVTLTDGGVAIGSQLECGSFTTATVSADVLAETVSWGTVKGRYR
jgi:hypothetical protein